MMPLGLMAPPPGQSQPGWVQLVPLVFIFVIFYFLLIRPARKRQKDVQKMLDNLKSGDRVITSGGLLGTIVAVDRNIVQLRVADKVKVDVTKSSIVGLQEPGPAGSSPAES
jgi:preprotein translocase subunit YajC